MGNLVVGPVCLCVHVSVRIYISVTAGRKFLILGMMMSYGLGMMPDLFLLIWSGIPDALTKMSVFEKGCHVISIYMHEQIT